MLRELVLELEDGRKARIRFTDHLEGIEELDSAKKKPTTKTPPVQPEELEPLAEIQVVGETFYKKSFEALRQELKTEGNTEHIVEVELRNDPDNQYSDSGKAVEVFIRNNKVGHVPEWLAPKIFDQLEPEGGTVTLGARLYLDYFDAKPQKNSRDGHTGFTPGREIAR